MSLGKWVGVGVLYAVLLALNNEGSSTSSPMVKDLHLVLKQKNEQKFQRMAKFLHLKQPTESRQSFQQLQAYVLRRI